MLLSMEQSREQDKQSSQEWSVNTDPGCIVYIHMYRSACSSVYKTNSIHV